VAADELTPSPASGAEDLDADSSSKEATLDGLKFSEIEDSNETTLSQEISDPGVARIVVVLHFGSCNPPQRQWLVRTKIPAMEFCKRKIMAIPEMMIHLHLKGEGKFYIS